MFSLQSLFRKTRQPAFDSPIAPERPFFAIGDIHGDYSGMEQILLRIEDTSDSPCVVCVGDYIDRGERSADVLAWLRQVNTSFPDDFFCLMGNHEQMLLQFLDDPEGQGDRWLAFGGLQTLASYKVSKAPGTSLEALRDDLSAAMGPEMIAWLRALPLVWVSGNVAVTHAGADPALPVAVQPQRNLIWGHPDFTRNVRDDGVWVVHGHTIVDEPSARQGRIAIDTGSYVTGRLTAAHVFDGGVDFLSTGG